MNNVGKRSKCFIRKMIPFIALGIALGAEYIFSSDCKEPLLLFIEEHKIIYFFFLALPVILGYYGYIWFYDRMRLRYDRWKIIVFSYITFLLLHLLYLPAGAGGAQIGKQCLIVSFYLFPFCILLLLTDAQQEKTKEAEKKVRITGLWLSPVFAVLFAALAEGMRTFLNRVIFQPPLRGGISDVLPVEWVLLLYYFPIMAFAWGIIGIDQLPLYESLKKKLKIMGWCGLAIFIYWYSLEQGGAFLWNIWNMVIFEIPFIGFVNYFVRQRVDTF